MTSPTPASRKSLLSLSVFVLVASAIVSLFLVASHARGSKGAGHTATSVDRLAANQPTGKASIIDREAYGKLPLSFALNQGQTDPRVSFISYGSGYALFLTADGAVLSLSKSTGEHNQRRQHTNAETVTRDSAVVSMRLRNASAQARVNGVDHLPGKVNYVRGNKPEAWRTNVPTYSGVRYQNIYAGVDLYYYGNQRQLEYDFEIAPGADPKIIRLEFTGGRLKLDRRGNLKVIAPGGAVSFLKPQAYQVVRGKRQSVFSQYILTATKEVAFSVGHYNKNLPLVIDPILSYSTYLGGADDEFGFGIAVDSAGSAYITGQTYSTDFPVTGSIHPDGSLDAFIAKLNPAGSALVYSTILGGSGADFAYGIAVNAAGNAFVTGETTSSDFPLLNPLDSTLGGSVDGFVAELNSAGSALLYATLLGGSGYDMGYSIALDQNGNAYVTGETGSHDFPLMNPIQSAKSGHALFKSSDAAGHWNVSDAGLAAVSTNGIAFDPTNSATLYAATDVSLFKSVNSGASWTPMPIQQTSISVGNVAIDPTNPAIIYAATNGGVFKSTDGGDHFLPNNTGRTSLFTRTVVINPLNPTTLYACGTGSSIFRTTNGAANWTSSNLNLASLAFSIAADPSNASVVYAGSNRGVYKSTNAGVTWLSPNTTLRSSVRSLAVDRNNSSTVYAGTNSAIFKSIDAGINWSDITMNGFFGSVNAIAMDPTDSAKLYYGSASNIYKSTDAGATWSLSSSGYPGTSVNSLIVDPSNPANLYVGTSSGSDVFVTKINSAGTAKVYSTYVGGSMSDVANGIAVDSAGGAYITGYTLSANFPSSNPFQPGNGGGYDAFVAKLNSAGSALEYSTYLGGYGTEVSWAIAVDSSGNAYVTGSTDSTNFPTANALQPAKASVFRDVFVTKLNASGTALDYSTYLGGTGDNQGHCIAVNSLGNAFVGGLTSSVDFPRSGQIGNLTPESGDTDAFVSKLDTTGSALIYSTRLGGTGFDQAWSIALDSADNAYVTGDTMSGDFPTVNPFQAVGDGSEQVFITKITASPSLLKFANNTFNVSEGAGSILVTVTREGNTTGTASVDYATADAGASQKRDYTIAAGTLSFAAGEIGKTFRILLTDNAFVDGTRAIKVSLSKAVGADLGEPIVASVLIADNDTVAPVGNPIDDALFFVRQHYYDFLSRIPDQGGLDYWSGQIMQCGSDEACVRTKRIDVSNAFFYEQEYQQTGAYVYRLYRAAFGNNQPFPNPFPNAQYPNEEKKIPNYQVFASDRARVKGGASLTQTQLDLANAFVLRPAFVTKYPATLNGPAFVDAVLLTISSEVGADLTSQRQPLIDLFNQGGRSAVLYRLADDNLQSNPINNRAYIDAEYNRAFVATQYFGYLRRDPDIPGFVFWLGQVNGAALRDVAKQHAMVCSFITSTEYQQRFSPVATHTNSECQP